MKKIRKQTVFKFNQTKDAIESFIQNDDLHSITEILSSLNEEDKKMHIFFIGKHSISSNKPIVFEYALKNNFHSFTGPLLSQIYSDLYEACKNGYDNIIEKFIHSPLFLHTSKQAIQVFLSLSVEHNQNNIAKKLINHQTFVFDNQTYIESIKKDNLEIFELLHQHSHLSQNNTMKVIGHYQAYRIAQFLINNSLDKTLFHETLLKDWEINHREKLSLYTNLDENLVNQAINSPKLKI